MHHSNEWCYSPKIARLDILVFALQFARFDILIFALLSNREIRHTRLRSHREIRYTHLRFQMARLGILVFALIREIRRYINLNFAQSQYDDRLEFRFIKMRRSIWISLHQMRRYIDLVFASTKRHDATSEIHYAINIGFVILKWKWINKKSPPSQLNAKRRAYRECVYFGFNTGPTNKCWTYPGSRFLHEGTSENKIRSVSPLYRR